MKSNCSKSFSDASNSSDIEEEVIKQINTLKPFNMEPRMAIPKKHFVSEEENGCEEGINLIPQDRVGNINQCKCGWDCKPMAIFAGSFCLLHRLKSWSVRGASHHSPSMGNCLTLSHTC